MSNSPLAIAVLDFLNLHLPNTLLALGSGANTLAGSYKNRHPESHIYCCDTATPDTRVDLALVLGYFEYLPKTEAQHVIARLRDTQAACVLVGVPLGVTQDGRASAWQVADFLALGMQLHAQVEQATGTLGLFSYAIHDYKAVPDWLNARYWAHPARWEPDLTPVFRIA